MPDVSFAVLIGSLVALAVFSFMLAPRARTPEGFFFGSSPAGVVPGVWTLTFSQVTTWIFARSLLNAGILGYFFGIALVISAASTMDSTFASTAKLTVIDMNLGRRSSGHGRIVMLLFAVAGLLMVFFGTQDLFAAVAVSGTAAPFLTPVIIWSIALDRTVVPAALAVAAALLSAVVYFLESSGHIGWIEGLTGITHNYSKLLLLNVLALAVGLSAFAVGDRGPVRGAG